MQMTVQFDDVASHHRCSSTHEGSHVPEMEPSALPFGIVTAGCDDQQRYARYQEATDNGANVSPATWPPKGKIDQTHAVQGSQYAHLA